MEISALTRVLWVVLIFSSFPAVAASPWPASSGVEITGNLAVVAPTFEPSGIVWHTRREEFIIVGDEGDLCTLSASGETATCYDVGSYDLEGVTVADVTSNLVYLAVEYSPTILQFDLTTGTLTDKSWSLSSWMTTNSSTGVEALTFVPNGDGSIVESSHGGLFYAGSQYDGKIYVFDVDTNTSGSVSFVTSFHPKSGYTDLAGLTYLSETDTVYAGYDGNDRLVEVTPTGTYIIHYEFAGDDQEGLTLIPSCDAGVAELVVGEDSGQSVGPEIWSYDNYPITCIAEEVVVVDVDGDGVEATADCNDNDATVSVNQTYYRDADGDGLGDAASQTSVCSSTAPSGTVTNASDSNDTDFDNDGVSTGSDCNDSDASLSANVTYYRDADGDGLGDAATTTSVCSNSAPSGYVTNNSDTNDSGTTTTTMSPIEISGNGVDDDGDGVVDEYNTVAENGYHPTYSGLDPASSSTYTSTVRSVTGSTYGIILVKYVDNSIYAYTVLSTSSSRTLYAKSWRSTGYIFVYNYSTREYAWVNVYTGVKY